ncbi:MAG: flavin reductase family protein [Candidatus Neomarinimicrobiota bacterium]
MKTTSIEQFYHFYPAVVNLVGARLGDKTNFMAAAWHSGVSHKPPLYLVSIAPKRFTHDLIAESGEFTCNFLDIRHLKMIHGTGTLSGHDGDKVKQLNIPLADSLEIACPIIASAYAAYECRVVHQYPAGDHTLFVGEVVAAHCDEKLVLDDGLLDPTKIDFALYLGSNNYLSADPDSRTYISRELEITRLGRR